MTRWTPVRKLWFVLTLPALILSGCGGGSSDRGDGRITIEGELTTNDFDENRYFDMYQFTAEVPGEATIELKSDDFDSILIVYREDGPGTYTEIAADDNSGDNRDARAVVPIQAGVRYRILVTARSRDTGEYELIYSYILGQAAQLVPTQDAVTVNNMRLNFGTLQKQDGQQ